MLKIFLDHLIRHMTKAEGGLPNRPEILVTESTRRRLPRLEYERISGPIRYIIFRQSP